MKGKVKGAPDKVSVEETDLTWLPLYRCGNRAGWGRDYMTMFVRLGAPSVAGKLSVKALHDWLVANAATIPKI